MSKHSGSPRPLLRPLHAAVIVALAGIIALTTAAKCQTPPRAVGFGLLQFDGDAKSAAWTNDSALGVNRLFTWAQLEPQQGQFDWSEFDALLEISRKNGKRLVPRVYTNIGGFGQATPDWVFDDGAEPYFQSDADPRQPVPTDAIFSEHFGQFLSILGKRYDGNPNIEFFQTNAGMGGYGEMVWGEPRDRLPPGWSPDVQVATTEHWIDAWRDAFPRTRLSLMENYVGYQIAERVVPHAVAQGYYLQANDPDQPDQSQDLLRSFAGSTRIIMEVEDRGCRSANGQAWDDMINEVFGYGFPIDYLVICGESFDDDLRARGARDLLRKDLTLH